MFSNHVLVVCLVVIQTIVNYQLMLNDINIKCVTNNYIDYKYNNTIHEWLQYRLPLWAYSRFSSHGGSPSCSHSNNSAVDVMHTKHSNTIKWLKCQLQYNNTIHEWLQDRLQLQAYSRIRSHGGSPSCSHSNNSLTNRHMDIHKVFNNL